MHLLLSFESNPLSVIAVEEHNVKVLVKVKSNLRISAY